MITIKNTQRRIKIDKKWLASFTARAVAAAGFADWGISVWVTTNQTIRRYNARFRHKDRPTDILSFPFYPDLKPGKKPQMVADEGDYLGDLIISAERVHTDAHELGVTFEERMQILIVHGVCHLLGHDHETEAQYRAMQRCERTVLEECTKK